MLIRKCRTLGAKKFSRQIKASHSVLWVANISKIIGMNLGWSRNVPKRPPLALIPSARPLHITFTHKLRALFDFLMPNKLQPISHPLHLINVLICSTIIADPGKSNLDKGFLVVCPNNLH